MPPYVFGPAEAAPAKVKFKKIWDAYPRGTPCLDKNGQPPQGWENQCAVRVAIALESAGVSLKTLGPGARCPGVSKATAMIGSAQRLADWLKSHPFPGCGKAVIVTPGGEWESRISGMTGIVFFKDYWRRRGENKGTGSGDHIDLWNEDELTPSIQSFMRFSLGISRMPNLNPFSDDQGNWYSDLSKSNQVWFWQVK